MSDTSRSTYVTTGSSYRVFSPEECEVHTKAFNAARKRLEASIYIQSVPDSPPIHVTCPNCGEKMYVHNRGQPSLCRCGLEWTAYVSANGVPQEGKK